MEKYSQLIMDARLIFNSVVPGQRNWHWHTESVCGKIMGTGRFLEYDSNLV